MTKKTAAAPAAPRRASPPPPLGSEPRIGLLVASGVYFALALLFFLPAFLPGEHIYGTDYIGGGYFFYHFISERIGAGALPKWVPYVFGGMPLFANPGSTFHPVHFFADLVVPTSRVLPAVFLAHFWIAGVGMYLLARELGTRSWIAFVAGLAFQFTGIITSWVYAGHDGRIIVATLAPLFFFCLHRGVRTLRVGPFAGASATLAVAFLSFQIQNSYYLLLGAGIWGVFCLWAFRAGRGPAAIGAGAAMGALSVAFAFALAAVNFLPFLGYVPESPRGMEGGRGYEYATSFSMPPAEILSLAVPEQHGVSIGDPRTGRPLFPPYEGQNPFKLHTEYAGAFVILMLVLGAAYARRDRYWLFFAGLSVFMLTIAFGGNTPLYRLYFELLPGTQRFRAPSLSFFMVAFSLVAMAAITAERLAVLREEAVRRATLRTPGPTGLERFPWLAGGLLGVVVLGMLLSASTPTAGAGGSVAAGWLRFGFFVAATAGVIWAWLRERIPSAAVLAALSLLVVADLWVIGRRFMHTIEPAEVTFAADDVVNFLRAQPEPSRVWTFPYPQHWRGAGAYGGNFPMLFGIEQVGGEHPNMLQRWVEYVGAGTQTYIDWNNLIGEAEVVQTADGPAIGWRGRDAFLNAANIRYIVSMAPLSHPSLMEVHRGSALVYENVAALPRAYLVPEARAVAGREMLPAMQAPGWNPSATAFVDAAAGVAISDGPLDGEATVVLHEPDRVVIRTRASREALMVLADNFYDGWEAQVGGRDAPVLLVNNTFRGVVVPAGEHEVTMTFRPRALYTGLYITLAGFGALLLLAVVIAVRSRRRPVAPAEAA